MQMHIGQWPLEEMARVLEISRSGYYRYGKDGLSKRAQENIRILAKIKIIAKESRQTYGSPRIHAELLARGLSCSRPRVARIIKAAGIKAKMSRLFKRTTRANPKAVVVPNLLNQEFKAQAPNQKWLSDISYIRTLEGWLYLAVVLDVFSRKIVGVARGPSLHTQLVTTALNQALSRRNPKQTLMHHSDRGC